VLHCASALSVSSRSKDTPASTSSSFRRAAAVFQFEKVTYFTTEIPLKNVTKLTLFFIIVDWVCTGDNSANGDEKNLKMN
jgi:hypothetical protein